jgi:hypothetical protein
LERDLVADSEEGFLIHFFLFLFLD